MKSAILTLLKNIFAYFERDFIISKRQNPKSPYESVFLSDIYAPWKTDREFNEVFAITSAYSLVRTHRSYELWQLVAETAHTAGALLEVGVWRGGTGALIAKRAQSLGIPDPVYLCDTFEGVVKAGGLDSAYKGGEHADTSVEVVEDLLKTLDVHNAQVLKGIFPDETAQKIPEGPIRFCHIDVDVYQSAKEVLEWVWPRLSSGGMVVFDDYGFRATSGVTRLVDEERGKDDNIVIHNLNAHGIIIKR